MQAPEANTNANAAALFTPLGRHMLALQTLLAANVVAYVDGDSETLAALNPIYQGIPLLCQLGARGGISKTAVIAPRRDRWVAGLRDCQMVEYPADEHAFRRG